MNKPRGGRGIRAPYESTHVRVPVPLKPKIDKMVDEYRALILDGKVPEREKHNCADAMTLTSLGEATALCKEILKQKKSAKVSLEKLLTALYGGEIKL